MIRLAVISGKGGTGKTMVTAALADLFANGQVLADCDVEAANLGLLLDGDLIGSEPFMGLEKAEIDHELCLFCGRCQAACRFGAIHEEAKEYCVDPLKCEGCGVCVHVCPAEAVTMQPYQAGEVLASSTTRGHLSHARLYPGSGNSGLLVHEVRKQAEAMAGESRLLLADGPPGIGCPLISTVSGMDAVVVVTEPGLSALHDLKRVVNVSRRFGVRIFVVINRFDLEANVCGEIERVCKDEGLLLLGKVPFDPSVVAAVRRGVPVTSTESPASEALYQIKEKLAEELGL
ncbi:(4Fe-4S)-binding protein [Methanofollis aquaemaris]|uniref:(4Fe-4S)-binding protein n=1 Tax=Methanofollis aquaemaris TaxID=126734 RepID=A0A8A3S6V4_9EURY|nr:ATP-binding protein [Methanofollis aquaemaris]QSZ67384.1 (4Fe-4S)-binding protein [Methanofollis aquaemaris]